MDGWSRQWNGEGCTILSVFTSSGFVLSLVLDPSLAPSFLALSPPLSFLVFLHSYYCPIPDIYLPSNRKITHMFKTSIPYDRYNPLVFTPPGYKTQIHTQQKIPTTEAVYYERFTVHIGINLLPAGNSFLTVSVDGQTRS